MLCIVQKKIEDMDEDEVRIIETDDDTWEDDAEDDSLYPYDPTTADIDIREEPHSIYDFMRKYDQGKLIIDPDFQRNLVWKQDQKSQFIESVILNFPLPALYVNQRTDGKYNIVDGLQRTTTLHQFLNNEFSLSKLEALTDLNGSNFSELIQRDEEYQTKIEDKKLTVYVIRPSVPIKVVYDIFKRINTNGTPLNRQEVRNCIYTGKSTHVLKDLAGKSYFKKAIGYGISSKRMKDREAVLRYLTFRLFDYNTYKGDMSGFVEDAMKKINRLDLSDINKLYKDFERTMKRSYEFFGDRNFRYPTEHTKGTVNMAMIESVGYFFAIKSDDFLNENKERIISNFQKLLDDPGYFEAVRYSTGSKSNVIKRFNKVQEILGAI